MVTKIIPFDDKKCETYSPILVKIITNCAGTDECQDIEWIFLCRELSFEEESELMKLKEPSDIRDIVDNIKEINEPTIYEIDLTTY
jgi:hypothetical protein